MLKYIEKDFPFAQLSLLAERESWRKEIYRPVYYLHKWWARRLGSVFRSIILGACLDDSEDFWNRFYNKNTFKDLTLFDPFMGSGVTIGEAIKLRCKVIGRDINPVAYLACRAAFSRYETEDIFNAYKNIEKTLAPIILNYFVTKTDSGEKATVLYYFLVKIVECPECGKNIDLFKTRIFSKNAITRNDPSARALCPECGSIVYTSFDSKNVVCPYCSNSFNPQNGNINGPFVCCDGCQFSFRLVDRMKSIDGPLGFRRYAKMIITKKDRKIYEPLNEFDKELEHRIEKEFSAIAVNFPPIAIEPGYNTDQILKHNYKFWYQLFSDRQLICINHITKAIRVIGDADIKLLFACLFSGILEFNNLFASFKGEGTGAVRHMFAHHILKPEMMPLEANIWGANKSSGAFSSLFHSRLKRALIYKSDPFELRLNKSKSMKARRINHPISAEISGNFLEFSSNPGSIYLSYGDSSCIDLPDKSINLVVTDPPFFDNVHYSQLADFFYYWLNQVLVFSPKITTRSTAEVQDTDPDLFTNKLTSVFAECRRVLKDNGLFIFTYHHSRHEGWTAVHRAIRHAGFVCTQAYPIKAEMSVSMPLQQNTSPIHLDLILVCRKDQKDSKANSNGGELFSALNLAKVQISMLKKVGIKVSLGDAKVILMGRFLCEAHRIRNLDSEERFLKALEKDIDAYVNQVVSVKGEVLYREKEAEQLRLFDEIKRFLSNKRMDQKSN